jgi:heptosyltransferase I
VLIVRLSAIGDACHVLTVVNTLRHAWPDTRFTWVLGRVEAKLLGDVPGVRVLAFDKQDRDARRVLKQQLRGERFDLLLQMQLSFRATRLALGVRARRRIGYPRSRSRELHSLAINERIAETDATHVLDVLFGFAEACGVHERVLDWTIPLSAQDHDWAGEHVPADRRTLVISPCASHPLRNWSAAGYAAVADHAAREHDMAVLLCGGRSEQEAALGAEIVARSTVPVTNLIGRDTLKQFFAVLQRADVLVSPDSGPVHMATAAGTPVIGLYAATSAERSGPYLSRALCVDRYAQAAQQFLGRPADTLRWGTKIERPGVMALIEPEAVTARLDQWARASSAPSAMLPSAGQRRLPVKPRPGEGQQRG